MDLVASTAGAQFTPAGILRLPVPPKIGEVPGEVLNFLGLSLAKLV